jgi:6-phosphofructokinase
LLGTRLGSAATHSLKNEQFGVLAGLIKSEVAYTPLETVVNNKKPLDPDLIKLAGVLAK